MRLVSWNIQGGLGMDRRRSLQRIAHALGQIQADVICLQEVHRFFPQSGFQDQPGRLQGLLQMPMHFHSCFRVGFSSFGNLLAARYPVQSLQFYPLTNTRERRRPAMRLERRGLMEATLDLPEGRRTVFVTHWGLDEEDRLINAEEVADRVKAAPAPVVLVGDMNARPESGEIRRLRELTGLRDGGEGGKQATYPSDVPRVRIDYLFHSPELTVQDLTIVDTQASDHRPVFAVL